MDTASNGIAIKVATVIVRVCCYIGNCKTLVMRWKSWSGTPVFRVDCALTLSVVFLLLLYRLKRPSTQHHPVPEREQQI